MHRRTIRSEPGGLNPRTIRSDRRETQRRSTPERHRLPAGSPCGPAQRTSCGSWGWCCVEEPHQLLITTPEQAESRLTTEVYPIDDLLFTDRTTPPWLLMDPYLDQQQRALQRLESKLKRPVTLEYRDMPLSDVVADVAVRLNDIILVNHEALEDLGIDERTPITVSYRDVPAAEALEWLLDDLGLTFTLHQEALVITTPRSGRGPTRCSAALCAGVLYEYPVGPLWPMSGPTGGMFGGMMGSAGMAGGGMGGGGGMGFGFGMGGGPFGMGGMGGGGGGFGMGGMGGFGGGSGGMSGGMGGGFFGGFGGFADPTGGGMQRPDAGLSSGGDATAESDERNRPTRGNKARHGIGDCRDTGRVASRPANGRGAVRLRRRFAYRNGDEHDCA